MPEGTIVVTSPAFANGAFIPRRYTCQGEDINPPLHWENIPENAQSLALIVDDPDAPAGTWTHWLVWNIDPKTDGIPANSLPPGVNLGKNDFQKLAYGGPCPPSGTHRYFFRLFALDARLNLPNGSSRADLEKVIAGHILAQGALIGRYQKE